MILFIDTADNEQMIVALRDGRAVVKQAIIPARRTQAEKLLPAIDKLLRTAKVKLTDLKEIRIANRGNSFTSLRIGVATANALGFSLGIKVSGREKGNTTKRIKKGFNIVEPVYDREPNITPKAVKFVSTKF